MAEIEEGDLSADNPAEEFQEVGLTETCRSQSVDIAVDRQEEHPSVVIHAVPGHEDDGDIVAGRRSPQPVEGIDNPVAGRIAVDDEFDVDLAIETASALFLQQILERGGVI